MSKKRDVRRPTEEKALANILREAKRLGMDDGDYLRGLYTRRRPIVVVQRDYDVPASEVQMFLDAMQ